ncbi:FMN-dependent NADH-azoreductase [Actinomycetospora chibensis]|jgi:FMN-dependent NADH-azoreductase|uniref:FMN dependent NADH:quinone oxidoreductase n=1 Tax=Actinomycetospora chibensis TaxID=663606 RepID=A0ABV9RSD5_9PSEU|nr:NAD(P)H-dependent oxidoreductase [Actinomycetospora chibensis]MDD7927467.1 NAD(P)H-dependent oxidoreductase [Actinomycetospora chibensis]
MSLFRLDSSIRTEGSVSREVADTVERTWLEQHPGRTVVRRDVGREPLPADLWTTAMGAGATPEADRTPEQRAAVALVGELADEVVAADALVIGSPLYNFGIAAHLKTWVDVLITDPRFAPGNQPLAGRPVALVVSRGGGYGPGTPREGWDHGTGWLVRILGDVWGGDVTVIEAELTLADTVPAMAELRPLAAQVRARAHETAGTWLVAS